MYGHFSYFFFFFGRYLGVLIVKARLFHLYLHAGTYRGGERNVDWLFLLLPVLSLAYGPIRIRRDPHYGCERLRIDMLTDLLQRFKAVKDRHLQVEDDDVEEVSGFVLRNRKGFEPVASNEHIKVGQKQVFKPTQDERAVVCYQDVQVF